jgi:hypothetical protein
MTLDDAASTLDVTEGHLKDLIRDGQLRARISGPPHRRRYDVNGVDVRARKRQLDARTRGLATHARPHGRKAKRVRKTHSPR